MTHHTIELIRYTSPRSEMVYLAVINRVTQPTAAESLAAIKTFNRETTIKVIPVW